MCTSVEEVPFNKPENAGNIGGCRVCNSHLQWISALFLFVQTEKELNIKSQPEPL
jgi:hypothetical protein